MNKIIIWVIKKKFIDERIDCIKKKIIIDKERDKEKSRINKKKKKGISSWQKFSLLF